MIIDLSPKIPRIELFALLESHGCSVKDHGPCIEINKDISALVLCEFAKEYHLDVKRPSSQEYVLRRKEEFKRRADLRTPTLSIA